MDAGTMLESAIVERFYRQRDFEYVPDTNGILSFSHPEYDFIIVHPDNIFNEVCLLEAKTSQKYLTEKTVVDYVTELYFTQWNFTLGVMLENDPELFSEHGYILMFSRGIDYFEIPLKFNKEHYQKCLAAVVEFRGRLESKEPPPLTDADLGTFYFRSNGDTLDANSEDLQTHSQLISVKLELEKLETERERLEAYFKRRLQEREALIDPDTRKYLVTWKNTAKGRTFKTYEKS